MGSGRVQQRETMNLPIDIPGPREPRPGRARVDTPKPAPFVVPKFLTRPDPSEGADAEVDVRDNEQSPDVPPVWHDKHDVAEQPTEAPAAEAADTVIRDLLRKTKAAEPSSESSRAEVVEPEKVFVAEQSPAPIVIPDAGIKERVDRIPPEDLPERLHVQVADDPIDALLADPFETTRFGANNLTLVTRINPPAGGDHREFGDNPTGLRLQWDDVEPMVLRTWEEACEQEFFAGSVLESWLEVGSHSVFVHFEIGEEMTIWKFTNAFRTVVEDAAERL